LAFAGMAVSSRNMPHRHGRGETISDAWHYVTVLARKPGALRNGAPFKAWVLPAALARLRGKLTGSDDCDRQMVAILAIVLMDGLPAVDAACAEAISEGIHSSDVIINILACQRPQTGIVHRAARRSKEDTRAGLL
jgi:hypothetical protein